MNHTLRRAIIPAVIVAATVSPAFTWAQTELAVSTGPAAIEAAAPTCVMMAQSGEWVSDPVLHSPWTPMLSGPLVCWAAFGGATVIMYLLCFMLFQSKVRQGSNAVAAFGGSMMWFAVAVAVAGYFMTGHLSYAQSWCIDHTMTGVIGAPPARSNADIIAQFGVGINEIIDRGAVPLNAHARLTPWYLWAAGAVVGAIVFALGFRSGSGSSSGPGGSSPSSVGPNASRKSVVEDW